MSPLASWLFLIAGAVIVLTVAFRFDYWESNVREARAERRLRRELQALERMYGKEPLDD